MARWVSEGQAAARTMLFGVACVLTGAMVSSGPELLQRAVAFWQPKPELMSMAPISTEMSMQMTVV